MEHWISDLETAAHDGVLAWLRKSVPTDQEVFDEVVRNDCYQIDLASGQSSDDSYDVVLDIGAHVGLFSLMAAKKWPRATIVAFEPQPENFRLLTLNIRGQRRIKAIQSAVVPQEYPIATWLDTSIYHEASRRWNPAGDLPVLGIGVREMLAEIPAGRLLLKTDCEGMEVDLLRELLPLRPPQRIEGEWHGNHDRVIELLRNYAVSDLQHGHSETGIFHARHH